MKSDYKNISSNQTENNFNRLLTTPTIPELNIITLSGQEKKLGSFIESKRKFKDKPFIIISTYTFCSGCIDICDSLKIKGLSDKYDVFLILERYDGKTINDDAIKNFFQKEKVKRLKNDFNLVSADEKEFRNTFIASATPLFALFDKDKRFVYSYIWMSYEAIDKVVFNGLNLINQNLMKREMTWLNKEGFPTNPNSKDASFFYSVKDLAMNKVTFKYGEKSNLQFESEFLIKNGYMYNDGKTITNKVSHNTDGSVKLTPISEINYKEGYPTIPYTSFYENGKVETKNPLNGTMYKYTNDGNVKMKGSVKNGVGEGVFYYYKEGTDTLLYSITFKNGILEGEYVEYNDDGKTIKKKGKYHENKWVTE